MNEYPNIQSPQTTQNQDDLTKRDSAARIQDDMSIRDFMALLRKNGLDEDAQLLNEMFNNMNEMDSQFRDMREKIQMLQSEVDRLRGDTPLTDQFKTEFCARCTRMRMHLDDLAERFMATKDSIINSAREGLQKFAIVGKSALHRACASMCDAGIKYFKDVIDTSQKGIAHDQNILDRIQSLKEASAQKRQIRGNLARTLLGLPTNAKATVKEAPILTTIRFYTEADRNKHEKNINISQKVISKLEGYRSKHLEAIEKNPSFDALLQNAKNRAEQLQNNVKEKFKDRGPSGPTL